MTKQETDRIQNAINHIKTSVDIDPWAMEIAVEAMEKQIPKMPRIKKDDYLLTDEYYCPICSHYFGTKGSRSIILFDKSKYCICGQKIDWSEDKNDT